MRGTRCRRVTPLANLTYSLPPGPGNLHIFSVSPPVCLSYFPLWLFHLIQQYQTLYCLKWTIIFKTEDIHLRSFFFSTNSGAEGGPNQKKKTSNQSDIYLRAKFDVSFLAAMDVLGKFGWAIMTRTTCQLCRVLLKPPVFRLSLWVDCNFSNPVNCHDWASFFTITHLWVSLGNVTGYSSPNFNVDMYYS